VRAEKTGVHDVNRRPPARYARNTQVSVESSKKEIERLLTRYGASSFASGWQSDNATIVFEAHNRRLRFDLPLPQSKGAKYEQECRTRWRCLALVIKAKLEAVSTGIVSFEEEFLAQTIVPGSGETFATWAGPQLAAAYEKGLKMPPLLGPSSLGQET
jgi:hypothetical protein